MANDNFGSLSRSIGPAFNRASPEKIRWANEAAMFERAIRMVEAKMPDGSYRKVLEEGVLNGVKETIESCRAAAKQIASMGLTCNPSAKLLYLIPRRVRERKPGETASEFATVPWVVDPQPSYMGLCYIGTQYAGVKVFGASEVYKADVFEPRGPFALPKHRPTTDNAQRSEKLCIGFYAGARLTTGDERAEYVDYPTEQLIRGLSKLPNSLMYTTVWTEGGKKIALRRLCKLVLIGNDRMMAAEDAMRAAEGFTFDNEGNVLEVPRGTTDAPEGAGAEKAARGMSGLGDKLKTASSATEGAAGDVGHPPPAEDRPTYLALPAPSKHPEGSIEWWLDQVQGADTRERLDTVRVGALGAKVDQDETMADAFRAAFVAKSRELKGVKR